jgi:Leucine-rich repeat (LRR) protein
LDLSNGNLLTINRRTFDDYQKLEELHIINSGVRSIQDGAFSALPQLRQLDLSRNFITEFTSQIFAPHNKLRKLVVADNLLTALDGFDVDQFRELALLDISNNQITRLPPNLLAKLQKGENFTLISENNPFDCTIERLLNDNLSSRFCNNELQHLPLSRKPPEASFVTCIFWISGSFWCGVIAGNVCMIKKLLWTNVATLKKDRGTQYGNTVRRVCPRLNQFSESFSFLTVKEFFENPPREICKTPISSPPELNRSPLSSGANQMYV